MGLGSEIDLTSMTNDMLIKVKEKFDKGLSNKDYIKEPLATKWLFSL